MPLPKPQNLDWISNLRVVALFAVIVLHASAVLLAQYGKVPLADWLTADAFNAMVRFSVPVFVMITGALNLGREYDPVDFLKKRLTRIVFPFLFWSMVYIGYSWYTGQIDFDNDSWTNLKQVLHLLKVGSSYHLWYVYMLIGLYLFIPVIGRFVRAATEKEIRYFLIVWLIIMIFTQPYLVRFKPPVELRYFEGYAGYLVLGHYLAFKNWSRQPWLWMVGLFLLMVLVITVGTYLLLLHHYPIDTLFYEPLGPFAVLLSASIFLAFRFGKRRVPAYVQKARDFTGRYAYGVYLCHALFLYLLDLMLNISYKLCTPIVSIPVTAVFCLILSVTLTWLLNKLPYVGKYVGG